MSSPQKVPRGGPRDRPRGRSRVPLGWAVVHGDSMRPGLAPGDRLLVRHGAPVRPGAVVVARFADGTLVLKRAVRRVTTRSGGAGWWLLGDNPDGVDSRHRGPVADDDVLAVALARVWPRPRLLRGGARPA